MRISVALADDEAWGITSELGPIRFDQVAEGFGAHGIRIHQADEIEPAIRKSLELDRPTLIHVPVVRSSPADG